VKRLRRETRRLLQDPANEIFVSAASIWELELKLAAKRLEVSEELVRAAEAAGFDFLPVRVEHAVVGARLPFHHADPFDRMLVAQAQREGLTIVTSDEKIPQYQVAVLPT
jgi:PIN domain nuclease of toxin-antitoxin system